MDRKKATQILQIQPGDKITFRPPFNVAATSSLNLLNPSEGQVAYKIKTTAPKRYCVRPNAGLLIPGDEAEIKITLQPGPTDEKHKFMVQTLPVDENYNSLDKDEQAMLWKDEDKRMASSKLVCEFKLDDIPETASELANEADYISSEPVYQHQQTMETPVPPKPADKVQFKLDDQSAPTAKEPKVSTLPQMAQPTPTNAAAEEIKQLKSRLSQALKQIEILSSSPPEANKNDDQTKTLMILLAVAFLAGFIVSSVL